LELVESRVIDASYEVLRKTGYTQCLTRDSMQSNLTVDLQSLNCLYLVCLFATNGSYVYLLYLRLQPPVCKILFVMSLFSKH